MEIHFRLCIIPLAFDRDVYPDQLDFDDYCVEQIGRWYLNFVFTGG